MEDMESENIEAWLSNIERHLEQWIASLPRTIIALLEGTQVGYMFWDCEAEKASLASVNVGPSYRRKGIGSALLNRFEEEARLVGCSVAELGFVSHNPARHLYERFGYQPMGAKGRYVMLAKHLRREQPSEVYK